MVAFAEVGESESLYIHENIQQYTIDPKAVNVVISPFGATTVSSNPAEPPDFAFKESMNGFVFGNLPGMTMKVGERVRWYLMATSNSNCARRIGTAIPARFSTCALMSLPF